MLSLSGALAVLALVAVGERAPAAVTPTATTLEPPRPLEEWSARELRSLPGLGEKRAVAIVRARWSGSIDGSLESLDRVPGIGEQTVEGLRAELELRRERAAPRSQRLADVRRAGGEHEQRADGVVPHATTSEEVTER
jgi:hypothetical protein